MPVLSRISTSGARRRRARGSCKSEPRGGAADRRLRQLVAGLGLDSRGDCHPSRDSPRSQQRTGVSNAGTRAFAIRPAQRSGAGHASHARDRTVGANQLRAVGTSRVSGSRVSRRSRIRTAGRSHGLGVLDRIRGARTAYERTGESDISRWKRSRTRRGSPAATARWFSLKGYILAKSGRANEAREVLRRLEAEPARGYVPPYAMALVHAGLVGSGARVRVARQSLRCA